MEIKKINTTNHKRLKTSNSKNTQARFETLVEWLFSTECILCLSTPKAKSIQKFNKHKLLCQYCLESLPLITTACTSCNTPLSQNTLCGVCISSQRYWDQCVAAFEYKGSIKKLVTEFKYGNTPALNQLLGQLLSEHISDHYDQQMPDYLLPVPAFRDRLQHKGFNQSLMLCKTLSSLLGIPILNIVQKTKSTHTQKGLSSRQRRSSIKNSFKLKKFDLKKSGTIKKIAIVDDVMTTGSTCSEIAKLLKKSGISSVEVWVLART